MALQPDDFIHPAGELDPEVYPGDELSGDLQVWIDQAADQAVDGVGEEAQAAYVYARAYGYICETLQNTPSEAEADEGTMYRRRMEQIRHFCSKASSYREDWQEAQGTAEENDTFAIQSPSRDDDRGEYTRPDARYPTESI